MGSADTRCCRRKTRGGLTREKTLALQVNSLIALRSLPSYREKSRWVGKRLLRFRHPLDRLRREGGRTRFGGGDEISPLPHLASPAYSGS